MYPTDFPNILSNLKYIYMKIAKIKGRDKLKDFSRRIHIIHNVLLFSLITFLRIFFKIKSYVASNG